MTDTLKPCPFCGGEAKQGEHWVTWCDREYVVACECGAARSDDTNAEAITAWNTRPTPPAWPENARFAYGDAVRVIVKREGQPRFPGYVIGWYQPMDGRHTGWVLEHERDGIIHVYPDAAVTLVRRASDADT